MELLQKYIFPIIMTILFIGLAGLLVAFVGIGTVPRVFAFFSWVTILVGALLYGMRYEGSTTSGHYGVGEMAYTSISRTFTSDNSLSVPNSDDSVLPTILIASGAIVVIVLTLLKFV